MNMKQKKEILRLCFKALDDIEKYENKLKEKSDFAEKTFTNEKRNIEDKLFILGHYSYYFQSIISEILEYEK